MRYSLPVAYLLWLISGAGALGLHRFYLGKVGTGFLWLFSAGLGGMGCLYDFFTLPRQVREANVRAQVEATMAMGELQSPRYPSRPGAAPKARPERVILGLARKNRGVVTPGEAAIEADITVDEARRELDRLASSGTAQLRVRTSGVVEYFFPEFSADKPEYVDI